MSGRRDRSRSPNKRNQGGFQGKDRFKILLKNLPYEVNWQKLKDIVKEACGEGVMFADIINNRNGKSAGFGSAEFKTKESMKQAVEKLDNYDVNGRKIKVNEDVNGEQLVRMCNKQGLDPGRSGMSAKGGYGDQSGPPRSGGYGGPPRGGGYGGPPPHSRGPPQSDRHDSYGGGDRYGRSAPQSSYGAPAGYGDELPHLNGVPINQLPGMDRLAPDVMEAIGKGPLGRTIFVRNLDYKVDIEKTKEVFGMAGTIQDVELIKDKDGKSRGFGTIMYAQPMEALKAIVMFHTQSLFDRKMFVKMDDNSRARKEKLPDGLSGINRAAAEIGEFGMPSNGRDRYSAPAPRNPEPDSYGSASYGGGSAGGYGADPYAAPSRGAYGGGAHRDTYSGNGGGYGAPKYPGSGCVVSLERLPPSATTARLRRLFEDAGRVSFVDLQDHGRATIRFESAYDAERAVGRFNGYMIEGHALLAHITD